MFYEVRTMAKLLSGGCDRAEAVDRIVSNNLFQYPTEKCVRHLAVLPKIQNIRWEEIKNNESNKY